jgi:hypothetical protein
MEMCSHETDEHQRHAVKGKRQPNRGVQEITSFQTDDSMLRD